MIKINLLRDQVKKSSGPGVASSFEGVGLGSMGGDNSAVLSKLGLVLVPIILAYGYSWYVESDLQEKIKSSNEKLVQIEAQAESLKPQLAEIESLIAEKNKISAQIGVIKELSKERYALVKIMDAMQTLIPEKAWIIKLSIKDRTVNLEGRAIDDIIVSSFMTNLEESLFFSNVTWLDSKEVNEPQGLVKQFSIRFQLEKI